MPGSKPFERLPTSVIPVNYKIQLQPDLEKFTFAGKETISVQVKSDVDTVVVNCLDIEIQKAVYTSNGQEVSSASIDYSKENETATIKFPSNIAVGSGDLALEFTGELNDKMKGFYRSKYTTPAGEERYCAVTQFESTDARRAFPCWDEPAVKATFDITLVASKDRVVLSNMNSISDQPSPDDPSLKVVTFATSPIMSTYLLAFVVGEFDFVEGRSADGVDVRVFTPLGKEDQGRFALEVSLKTLPFYKDYFSVAYPLPKIDLIAIPDFAAGAMENWGLVTYRETALLVDPENSSAKAKQWVAIVVGHELAHQWFGNLVTMEWWTHLWLNEGFASWIEYLCVDHCFPEYDIWTQFITNDYTRALELDALKNSHPIEVPVGHPDEVDEIFDLISYCKGASVIRMLHDFIGDDTFRKGMNVYLERHKYKNTFTEDLWQALGEASGKPIEDIMGTWTKQMGFPVLKVTREQQGDKQVLSISQEKFCADGQKQEGDFKWMVPISIATSSQPTKTIEKVVLDKESTTVTVVADKSEGIKLNPGTVGFYRVQYSSEMLEALLPGIRNQVLPARDRLGLESDLFALAKTGQASTVDVLKLFEAFENETDYTVWTELATNLGAIGVLLSSTDHLDHLKAFAKQLFSKVHARLGWDPVENENHLDALLRALVIRVMGRNGHEATVEEARKRFAAHCSGGAQLPADLRNSVYLTVLAHGDEDTLNKMIEFFKAQDLQEEKDRIQRSLGAIKDPALIKRVLEFSMGEHVRSQDTVFVISGVTGTKTGRELAWQFLQDRWSELHERFSGGFLLARLVQSCTEGFTTEERAVEVQAFFEAHPAPAAERTVQQSLENIRLKAKWLARDGDSIGQWLRNKVSP
ncbi:puromycin-sensitive aminopeptidase-like [Lytechinus variegatus]|uniref:puromycin-sensitive aminopeptidase-like n=1 Tax=Lytechinus variegatus TaxID=7654 RepID=UPI001BB198E5|nr:puromycin-sensitive aminopeptidase-like [Lytechinus variegatus]